MKTDTVELSILVISLTASLINQYLILVYILSYAGTQVLFWYNIYGSVKNLFQFAYHRCVFQKTDTTFIELHEDIDIA